MDKLVQSFTILVTSLNVNGFPGDDRMHSEATCQARPSDWVAVLFALVLPTLVTLAYFVWAERFPERVQQTTYLVAKVVQFAFPLVWVLWVQRQRPRWPQPVTRGTGLGLAFGLAATAAMLALYYFWLRSAGFFATAEQQILDKIRDLGLEQPWKFILLGVFYSLLHSFLEEYYWRWFVFGQLQQLSPLAAAILISSLGFMAHHVIVLATYFGIASPITWLFSLAIAVGGAFWAWLYHRSGSLLGPWLGHLLVDAAIFWVGYELVMKA